MTSPSTITPNASTLAISSNIFKSGGSVREPVNGTRYLVLAYMRVSHARQEDNHTFETQLARIREKLDSHFGAGTYDLEVHQDDGLSGGYGPTATGVEKRTRASLLEVEAKLKSGRYDGFIVYKLNRLFRSYRWMGQWLEDVLLPCKADILSATENFDFNTSQGRAFIMMVAIFDASAREGMAERNCDAQRMRSESGYLLGPPPYGWRRQTLTEVAPGTRPGVVPVEEEKVNVLFMVEKYVAGWGSTKIAANLNERGIRTKGGAKWTAATVMHVLHHPAHCGYTNTKRKGMIQGQHYENRFYDLEGYEQIQQTVKLRHKYGRTNTNKADSPHLVNGIATCARCGKRLHIFTGSAAYRAYRCQNGVREGQRTCGNVTVRADWIEDAVVKEIASLSEQPEMRELLLNEATHLATEQDSQLQQERDRLQAAVRQLEEREQRLVAKLSEGVLDDEQFKQGSVGLREEKTHLRAKLAEAEVALANRSQREAWVRQVQEAVMNFPLCWEHLILDERRQLLKVLIEHLSVDRVGRDAVVKLKLHLLPEREILLAFQSTRQMKERPLGVQALTRRQMAYLHHVGQGLSNQEIAQVMGITVMGCYQWALQIRKLLGIRDLQQAYLMAQQRIESQLHNLPLGPTMLCKIHTAEVPVLGQSLLLVLRPLAQGASVKEVAKLTDLTVDAVTARKKRILDALQVESPYEAAQKAGELGLL